MVSHVPNLSPRGTRLVRITGLARPAAAQPHLLLGGEYISGAESAGERLQVTGLHSPANAALSRRERRITLDARRCLRESQPGLHAASPRFAAATASTSSCQ